MARLLTIIAPLVSFASALPLTQTSSIHPRTPTNISSIIVFGDSYSDDGNEYRLSNQTWPSNPAYNGGRFTNGIEWNELVAQNLSVPLHNYAYGGATTSNALAQGFSGANGTIPVPSLEEQVGQYLNAVPADVAVDSSLMVLFGGANDFFFDPNVTAVQTAGVLSGLVTRLRNAGATQFLLLNYPDLSMIPYDSYIPLDSQQQISQYSLELGASLQSLAQGVSNSGAFSRVASEAASVDVTFVDLSPVFATFGFHEQGWRDAGFDQFGLYGSCLTGVYMEAPYTQCDNVDQRVWWDEYHPTARGHQVIAGVVLDALAEA